MAMYTKNYNLKKPAPTDFVDIQDLNDNADIIDETLKAKADLTSGKLAQSEIPNIDCGIWDSDPIAAHNANESAHINMAIDGNTTEIADNSMTLEEHIVNPVAHQNLIVDGNEN